MPRVRSEVLTLSSFLCLLRAEMLGDVVSRWQVVYPDTPAHAAVIQKSSTSNVLLLPCHNCVRDEYELCWDLANGPATSSVMGQGCLWDEDSGLILLVVSVGRK
jgi:hypothetical protein